MRLVLILQANIPSVSTLSGNVRKEILKGLNNEEMQALILTLSQASTCLYSLLVYKINLLS